MGVKPITINVESKLSIEIPMRPNLFRVVGVENTVPIETFDDETIKAVGTAWVNEMLKEAQTKREQRRKAADMAVRAAQ